MHGAPKCRGPVATLPGSVLRESRRLPASSHEPRSHTRPPAPCPSPGPSMRPGQRKDRRAKRGCSASEGRWGLLVLSSPLTFVPASTHPRPVGGGGRQESRVSCAEGPLGTESCQGLQTGLPRCRNRDSSARFIWPPPGGAAALGDLSLPLLSPVPIKSQERPPRPLGMQSAVMT